MQMGNMIRWRYFWQFK